VVARRGPAEVRRASGHVAVDQLDEIDSKHNQGDPSQRCHVKLATAGATASLGAPEPPPHGRRSQSYGAALFEPAEEPSVDFEVVLVSGEEGAELRAVQAQAIKEVLTWLQSERRRRPGGGTR
jgi:hypothetical protein